MHSCIQSRYALRQKEFLWATSPQQNAANAPSSSALPYQISLWDAEDSLDELSRLTDTALLVEAGRVLQSRERVDPTCYIGKGKVEEVKKLAGDLQADMLVFDNELSPAQMRNLKSAPICGCSIAAP